MSGSTRATTEFRFKAPAVRVDVRNVGYRRAINTFASRFDRYGKHAAGADPGMVGNPRELLVATREPTQLRHARTRPQVGLEVLKKLPT
jgi:hypothetical protein